MTDWLSDSQARTLVGLEPADTADNAAFTAAVSAARAWVEGKRPDLLSTADPPVYTPTADVLLGTAMLANRWYQRRGTPLGQPDFTEFGGGGILRNDPDIAKLLGIEHQGKFRFGVGRPAPVVEEEVAP